jgi:hypothetical protein
MQLEASRLPLEIFGELAYGQRHKNPLVTTPSLPLFLIFPPQSTNPHLLPPSFLELAGRLEQAMVTVSPCAGTTSWWFATCHGALGGALAQRAGCGAALHAGCPLRRARTSIWWEGEAELHRRGRPRRLATYLLSPHATKLMPSLAARPWLRLWRPTTTWTIGRAIMDNGQRHGNLSLASVHSPSGVLDPPL